MRKNKAATRAGTSILEVLLVVFVVLKLTGNIDWSWWWVTSPFWIPAGLAVGIFLPLILLGTVRVFTAKRRQNKNLSKQWEEMRSDG